MESMLIKVFCLKNYVESSQAENQVMKYETVIASCTEKEYMETTMQQRN